MSKVFTMSAAGTLANGEGQSSRHCSRVVAVFLGGAAVVFGAVELKQSLLRKSIPT